MASVKRAKGLMEKEIKAIIKVFLIMLGFSAAVVALAAIEEKYRLNS